MGKTRGILNVDMEVATIELQHVNVKLPVKPGAAIDLASAVPIFHRWIQAQLCDELLLDVADYTHVPDGPGIVLIGHEANYALDNSDGRLGVRYNRKAPLPGTNQERLQQATRSALRAFARLQQDLKLDLNGREIEIFINDRLLAPNTVRTRTAAEPEFQRLLSKLWVGVDYSLTYPTEPRRLFGVRAQVAREFSLEELLENLGNEFTPA